MYRRTKFPYRYIGQPKGPGGNYTSYYWDGVQLHHLGTFETPEEAALCSEKKLMEVDGKGYVPPPYAEEIGLNDLIL